MLRRSLCQQRLCHVLVQLCCADVMLHVNPPDLSVALASLAAWHAAADGRRCPPPVVLVRLALLVWSQLHSARKNQMLQGLSVCWLGKGLRH